MMLQVPKAKHYLATLVMWLLCSTATAQTVKGLYVDGFASILGNTQKEDSLLAFAQNNDFNYLTLYQMHLVHATTPLNAIGSSAPLANFIAKAKQQFGILQIGVAGENYSFFENVVYAYNQLHPAQTERVDVYNLEFEFWVPSSILPGGVYCVDYLTNAGYTCDSAGAFSYYKKMLHQVDSLANAQGATSETYFGWFSATEGAAIVQTGVDRILLSVYLPTANYSAQYQYGYLATRLQNLASGNTPIKVIPIYSAEPAFMQNWASVNPFFLPFTELNNSLATETATWKNYISLEGIQWFAYTDMPKKNALSAAEGVGTDGFYAFPNPSCGTMQLHNLRLDDILKIYTLEGKLVYSQKVSAPNHCIDLRAAPTGIYILSYETPQGTCIGHSKLTVNKH
jgi:hypothetical protein